MNRAQLETALRDIAADAGYTFCAAGDEYASRSVKAYPAAWLSPPVMHSIEGRRHGRISYDVTLHLLDKGAKLSNGQRNAKWDELESDMTYTYDAGVTDTYAENGFWEDNNRKPARVSGQRKPATKGKAKGPASSKCVKKKTAGKTTDTKPKSKPKQGSSQRKPAQRRRR